MLKYEQNIHCFMLVRNKYNDSCLQLTIQLFALKTLTKRVNSRARVCKFICFFPSTTQYYINWRKKKQLHWKTIEQYSKVQYRKNHHAHYCMIGINVNRIYFLYIYTHSHIMAKNLQATDMMAARDIIDFSTLVKLKDSYCFYTASIIYLDHLTTLYTLF